jgi:hypothetical protein
MSGSKSITALSVAVVLGVFGAASAAVASDHENQSGGFRYGPQGQVFGTSSYSSSGGAYAATKPKPKPIHAGAAARTAYGANAGSPTALDALAVQHKDRGWDHRYQSWCDVDPNCNGWTKKIEEYEATLKK